MRARKLTIGALVTTGFILLSERPAFALPGEGLVSDAIGSGMSAAFDTVASGMTSWVLNSVAYFANGVANFLKTAGRPQIDSVWFSGTDSPYASVRNVAVSLLLAFLLLGLIQGLLHGDIGGMLRRIAGTLPAAVLGMAVAPEIVGHLLDLTDALSTEVLTNSGGDAMNFLTTFGVAIDATTNGFGALVVGVFAVLAGLLLWIELMLRSALVYFLVALSPLAFAAMVWPTARGVLRRLTELLTGVIFSKLVICVALAVGTAALGNATHAAGGDAGVGTAASTGMGALLTGTTLLVLASWSPFLLLRMIPIAETAIIAQGVSRAPIRAAASGASSVSSFTSIARLAGSTTAGVANATSTKGSAPSPRFTKSSKDKAPR